MAQFKLCIANPKTGKCYQKEVKDQEAQGFLGLNVGENIPNVVVNHINGY